MIKKGIKPGAARREDKVKSMPPEPIFRLGLSTKGSLSIETATHDITFTSRQTQALAVFLSAKVQKEKEPS